MRFLLYGHACGWRYWTVEDDTLPTHDCKDPTPLVVIPAAMWRDKEGAPANRGACCGDCGCAT